MRGIRTSITLIDNITKILKDVTSQSDKLKNSVDSTKKSMNTPDNLSKDLEKSIQSSKLLQKQIENQANIVDRYKRKLDELDDRGADIDSSKYQNAISKMLDAEQRLMSLTNKFDKTKTTIGKQESELKKLLGTQDTAAKSTDNLGKSATGLTDKIFGIGKALIGLKIGIKILSSLKNTIKQVIGEASNLSREASILQGAFGNLKIGQVYFNRLRKYARETNRDISELTDVTKNFMQLTNNTKNLMELTKLSNRFAMRTGSIGSAESMIQEAFRGETSRLQRSLHLTDEQVKPLKDSIKKGTMSGVLEALDGLLDQAGLTEEMEKAFYNNPAAQMERLKNTWKDKVADMGQGALNALMPITERLTNALDSDKANKLFSFISGIFTVATEGFSLLINTIMNIGSTIWDMGASIVSFLGGIVGGINILGGDVLTVVATVIGGVVALGTAIANIVRFIWNNLIHPLITNIALGFRSLGFIVALVWHGISLAVFSFAEVAGDTLSGFINSGIDMFERFFNGIIEGWNNVVDAIQSVSFTIPEWIPGFGGKEFGLGKGLKKKDEISLDRVDIGAWGRKGKEGLKLPTLADQLDLPKLEYTSISDNFNSAKGWVMDLPDKFTKSVKSLEDLIEEGEETEDKWNKGALDTIPKLIDKGNKDREKGNKDRKKDNEDLKWLRDLAEREVINRFTTAQVAPQITIAFGDVHETADVDGIVDHLKNIIQEGISTSAEGVHG